MQVQPNIDLNFANGVRALMRQDPDIIMLGEIRDLETAHIREDILLRHKHVIHDDFASDRCAIPRSEFAGFLRNHLDQPSSGPWVC